MADIMLKRDGRLRETAPAQRQGAALRDERPH